MLVPLHTKTAFLFAGTIFIAGCSGLVSASRTENPSTEPPQEQRSQSTEPDDSEKEVGSSSPGTGSKKNPQPSSNDPQPSSNDPQPSSNDQCLTRYRFVEYAQRKHTRDKIQTRTFDRDGRKVRAMKEFGSVHTYEYDDSGRLTHRFSDWGGDGESDRDRQ